MGEAFEPGSSRKKALAPYHSTHGFRQKTPGQLYESQFIGANTQSLASEKDFVFNPTGGLPSQGSSHREASTGVSFYKNFSRVMYRDRDLTEEILSGRVPSDDALKQFLHTLELERFAGCGWI